MEYVFGTRGDAEILKTKGASHTSLTGYHQIERVYPDQTITDNFRVVRKIDSKEDSEGNCYDWYEIERHYRTSDKSGALAQKTDASVTAIENAMCEQDSAIQERLESIELALCDLDETISA